MVTIIFIHGFTTCTYFLECITEFTRMQPDILYMHFGFRQILQKKIYLYYINQTDKLLYELNDSLDN